MLPGLAAAPKRHSVMEECHSTHCQVEKADLRQQVADLQHQCAQLRAKTQEQAAVIRQLQQEWHSPTRAPARRIQSAVEATGAGAGGSGNAHGRGGPKALARRSSKRRRSKWKAKHDSALRIAAIAAMQEIGDDTDESRGPVMYDVPSDSESDAVRDDGISSSNSNSNSNASEPDHTFDCGAHMLHPPHAAHVPNVLHLTGTKEQLSAMYDEDGSSTRADTINQSRPPPPSVPPPPPPPPQPLLAMAKAMSCDQLQQQQQHHQHHHQRQQQRHEDDGDATSSTTPPVARSKSLVAAMQILRGAASVRQCQNHNRDASKQPTSEQAEHAAAALLQACVRGFQSRVQTFLLRAKSHDRQRDVHALLTEIEASNRLVRQRLLASNGTRATITRHTLRTAEGALVLVNGKTPARTARRGGGGAGGAGDYDDSRSESNTDDGVPGSEGGLWARRDATATSTDNCFCCKMYRERNTTAQCKEHACTRTRGAASAGTPNARSNPAAAAATATATAAAVDRTAAAVKQVAQAAAATGRHKGRERTAPSGFDSRNRVPAVQAPICLEDVMVESRDDWCRWFHGNPDRARLKAQLKARHHGAFLVRISDSHRCFVVSANDCGSVRHFLLGQDKKGRYGVVGWEQKGVHVRFLRRPLFPTIQELIVHYMTHPISPTCTLREALLRDPAVHLKVSLPSPKSRPHTHRHNRNHGHHHNHKHDRRRGSQEHLLGSGPSSNGVMASPV